MVVKGHSTYSRKIVCISRAYSVVDQFDQETGNREDLFEGRVTGKVCPFARFVPPSSFTVP